MAMRVLAGRIGRWHGVVMLVLMVLVVNMLVFVLHGLVGMHVTVMLSQV